jgi:isopentenyl phosphate kinase
MVIFLKLGGSLITEKDKPYTARREVIARIGEEIASALKEQNGLQILLGHGSGSFGHFAAKDYGTRERVTNPREWGGFQKVWYAAQSLNRIVIDELARAGLPVISLPPSASVLTENRKVKVWNSGPIQSALANGLIPVIFGDVIFDTQLGGIIYSTEDLFIELLPAIQPYRILLAGREPGVWKDYPHNTAVIPAITAASFQSTQANIAHSASVDVTGGMAAKVRLMLDVVSAHPDIHARIFSGEQPGNIRQALNGAEIGTSIES